MANPNYERIETGGLGAELINYFHVTNAKLDSTGVPTARTLHDFIDDCDSFYENRYPDLAFELRRFIQNLINDAILYSVGFDPAQPLPLSERFLSYEFSDELAAYGSYEFSAFGFSEVRQHFKDSVIPLFVQKYDETEKIGTCFVIENRRLVTALHCLPKDSMISIPGWNPEENRLLSIRTFGVETPVPPFSKAGSIDLAVLQFESDPFPSAKKFRLWKGEVLQGVLCMGYPEMTGFPAIESFPPPLITGTGEIVGEERAPIAQNDYLLFSARVNVGNSGGPVLNRLGKVVGVVTEMLRGSDSTPDILGYGLATPSPSLFTLLNECDADSTDLYKVPFNQLGGLRII